MTDPEHAEPYEQRVQAIRQANQPILEGFEHWLRQSGLREQTIRDHVDNLRLFEHYLLLYAHSLRRLDEATDSEVYWFLTDWFPKPRAVGVCFQYEGVPGLVQEILYLDGRNGSRVSRNRCGCALDAQRGAPRFSQSRGGVGSA